MRTLTIAATITALALVVGSAATAVAQDQVTWKMQSAYPVLYQNSGERNRHRIPALQFLILTVNIFDLSFAITSPTITMSGTIKGSTTD